MFDFLNKPLKSGALPDTRTFEERAKDFRFEEIVASANPVQWTEKPRESWKKYPIFNQDGSGSCVAQTAAKLLGIIYAQRNNSQYVHFSATDIYQRRSNKPQSGMVGTNAFDILRVGATLETLVPSQNMNDSQMDSAIVEPYKRRVGDVFKIGNYVILPIRDIETVASTIQTTGKGIMLWFFFKYDEWTNVPFVQDGSLPQSGGATVRHSVTGVDFTMWEGKKAIVIEDSWGQFFGFDGQRVITEDFFKDRNIFAAYPIDFDFTEKPDQTVKYKFTKPLSFSTAVEYLDDVKPLQDFLKLQGTFPQNVASTGYYGSVTAKGVLNWQLANQTKFAAIDPKWTKEALTSLEGKYFGNVSIQVANQQTK